MRYEICNRNPIQLVRERETKVSSVILSANECSGFFPVLGVRKTSCAAAFGLVNG